MAGWWNEQVVPRLTDRALDSPEVRDLRARTCAGLRGDVVEVGFGSGTSLPHLPAEVTSLTPVEPSAVAVRLSDRRRAASPVAVRAVVPDAQRLPLPDDAYDGALSVFTMCSIPDLPAALAELRRVLRPGAPLHFVEHGRSPHPRVERWQDRLQPVWGRFAAGCHITRPIPDLLTAAGFVIEGLETISLPGPAPWTHVFLGRALGSTSTAL